MRHFIIVLLSLFIINNLVAQQYSYGIPTSKHGDQVVFFEHPNFTGNSIALNTEKAYVGDQMNNRISSIVVPLGKRAILFKDKGTMGRMTILYPGNYAHIGSWNDQISSVEIETIPEDAPIAYFFQHPNTSERQIFQGFGEGEYQKSNLFCNDCFTALIVKGRASVIAYEHDNYEGRSSERNPFEAASRPYDLRNYNLNDVISSIKVIGQTFALKTIEFSDRRILKTHDKKMVAVNTSQVNGSSRDAIQMLNVTYAYASSMTETKQLTLSSGTKVSVSTKFRVGFLGTGGEVTTTLEQAFNASRASGSAETINFSKNLGIRQQATVPPGCQQSLEMIVTPIEAEYTATKTYVPINEEGEEIAGEAIIEKSKVVIKTAQDASGIIKENCNGQTVQPDTPTSNTLGSTAYFCDEDGYVIGSFEKQNSTLWHELDQSGVVRFRYQVVERGTAAIVLFDPSRQVTIRLNKASMQIEYKDSNNPNFFPLYTITSFE